jgi:hypothetical protein
MPQLIVLMAAGVGLYSAYKWVSREAAKATAAADRARDELRRRTDAAETGGPKDLGALVFDEATGTYRPKV